MSDKNKSIPIQKSEPDLYKRSIKGGFWIVIIRLATHLSGFVKSIIVFNFLYQHNLELIIVANLLMSVLNITTESGFQAALIQKRENIDAYLDTVWVAGIVRGILLFSVVYAVTPLFVLIRVDPEDIPLAVSVLRAMGLVFLINGFQNIGVVYFRKELEFHKTFWLSMTGTAVDIVLSITLIVIYQSVWAYVIARLAASLTSLFMSYLLCTYRPRFQFSLQKARELWKFAKWMFGGHMVDYILTEGDDWFVWFFFNSPEPLKLYRFAYRFSDLPATHIAQTISQVTFPAYSKIQNELPRLRDAYLKVLLVTALVSVPAAFLIFALGPDFIRLFLVEESHAMIPVIKVLAFYGLIKSLGVTRGPVFQATGNPHIPWKLHIVGLVIMAVLIYPFTSLWGIVGTALSVLAMTLYVNSMGIHKAKHILNCSVWDIRRPVYLPLAASVLMYGVLAGLRQAFDGRLTYLSFASMAAGSIVAYIGFLWMLDGLYPMGVRLLIRESFTDIKKKLQIKT